jgi:hypothetical protein
LTPLTEAALLARLDGLGFKSVLSVSDAVGGVNSQLAPAAFVGFGGYSVEESSADSRASRVEEVWNIYIVTKQAKQKGAQEGRSESLTLARAAFLAIAGFIPSHSKSPFVPISPSDSPSWDSGFSWITLTFTHQTILKA